jgi:hypothetical protein
MLMKYKELGKSLSKEEMKKVKGGKPPCVLPVCAGETCGNCNDHCEWGPGGWRCVNGAVS